MPEEVKEVVVEEGAGTDTSQEPAVTVDLEAKAPATPSAEDQLAEKIKADLSKLYESRLESLESRLKGSFRINEKLQREVEGLRTQPLPRPAPSPAPVATKDELDALVEKGDWKIAVSKIAEQRAQELLQQQLVLQQQFEAQRKNEELLAQSKQTVVERYPDLDPETGDPDSDVSQAYIQVLNQDASLLSNVHGPEIAMYRMEQLLQQAQNTQSAGEPPVNTEMIRRQRANQSGLPPSRPVAKGSQVILTKEQKEFCDYWGIPPLDYAKNLRMAEQTGAIELS